MTFDEARTLWQAHEAPAGALPERRILQTVQARADAFDRLVRRRDRRESLAAGFVATAFGLTSILLLIAGLHLASAGATVVVLASAWIYWKLNSTRVRHTYDEAGLPVAHTLLRELEKVDAQIDLLRSVFWWYLLPLLGGMLLFLIGLDGTASLGRWALLIGALGGAVYGLNRYAIHAELKPRRAELHALLRELTDEMD